MVVPRAVSNSKSKNMTKFEKIGPINWRQNTSTEGCSKFEVRKYDKFTRKLWQAIVDKNGVFSNITNSFSNSTNSITNITNSLINITNSFRNINN